LQAKDLGAVGSTGSVEPTGETVREDVAAKQRVQDTKTAAVRRSLPPPPPPPKGVLMDSPEIVAKSMGESESSMVEVTLNDSPAIVEKSESPAVTSAPATPNTTGQQPEGMPETSLEKLEEVPRLDCETSVVQLSPVTQKEPVVSAEAEVKGESAMPVAKKVPEPTIESFDMAPLRSPIIRSNPEQGEKQKTKLENREPKKDSVTKRISQRLQQEPAAGMKSESPNPPTSPTAPPKRNLSNSFAARRAMFEKK
jgi:hypothetical protein